MGKTGYNPLVSVIIPSYNHAEFLPVCLESILNQSYRNLECIIVDDGSTDNTEQVVSEFIKEDKRIRYFRQENRGVSTARNTGLDMAKGDLITLMDADDWLNKKLYETQVQCIAENNLAGRDFVVYSDHKIIRDDKEGEKVEDIQNTTGQLSKNELIQRMLGIERGSYPPLHFNCCLISRSVFDDIRFTESQFAYVDLECWYRILISDAEFIYTPVTGMYYRRHQNLITSDRDRMRRGYLTCLENICKVNKEDLVYIRDMNEILRYFSVIRDKIMLDRAIHLIRNSPVPVYINSSRNVKPRLLALDKLHLLNAWLYLYFIENKLIRFKSKTRAIAGKMYRNLFRPSE
jgi:glycosyltransferase involved in cell wall biosynthesis